MRGHKFLLVACLCLIVGYSEAAPVKAPHEADIATGVIIGRLTENGKTPLAGSTVTLEVLSGHDLILTIPKQTDAKGQFLFKNIFQSPDFSYAISAEYEGEIYRTDFISLKEGEKSANIDLAVGGEHMCSHKKSLSDYQLLAIILSLAAIGYAVWQRRKKK